MTTPEDYVIATGEAHSVRECCEIAFDEAGLGDFEPYVTIDPSFVRPAEVDHLIGDASQGRARPRLEAADELRGADPPDDTLGPRPAGTELSTLAVPLFDTSTPLAGLREELRAAVERVLDSERYILGPEVEAFEAEFADYCGAGHAVGVANGTEAITIALRAMGVGPGDEVVVPSFTFYASAEAIPPTGRAAGLLRHRPRHLLRHGRHGPRRVDPRTKAVVAVHLFGNVAPVAEIEALGVPVLEDAAQAAGSTSEQGRPGALGTAATFSFFPSKNLGCFGDGGMITTGDADLAERVRVLRFHGSHDKVTYERVGYNSRLDELQAAILRVQLPHLDRLVRRPQAGRPPLRAGGTRRAGETAARRARSLAGVAPVRDRRHRGAARRSGARRRRDRLQALLPHPRAPPGRDVRVGVRRRADGDRVRGPLPPGDPDEPGAHTRAGRRGGRGAERVALNRSLFSRRVRIGSAPRLAGAVM